MREKLAIIVLTPVAMFIIMALQAYLTMMAWNFIMPFLFKLPAITMVHAFAINVLLIIFRRK